MSATNPTIAPGIQIQDPDLWTLFDTQHGQVRRREYTPLGRLERIQIEAPGVAILDGNPLAGDKKRTASLDWYKTGPLIGLSDDQRSLLVCSPIGLPPPIPVAADVTVEQPLEHLAAGAWVSNGAAWIVLQPVHQALILRAGGGFTIATFKADGRGKHCCLLIDPEGMQAHFVYGRVELSEFK